MNRNEVKKALALLFKSYKDGECSTEFFCDRFIGLYYFVESGHRFFSGDDKSELDMMAKVAERFSPYLEDHVQFPQAYTTEDEVKRTFESIKTHFEHTWQDHDN